MDLEYDNFLACCQGKKYSDDIKYNKYIKELLEADHNFCEPIRGDTGLSISPIDAEFDEEQFNYDIKGNMYGRDGSYSELIEVLNLNSSEVLKALRRETFKLWKDKKKEGKKLVELDIRNVPFCFVIDYIYRTDEKMLNITD